MIGLEPEKRPSKGPNRQSVSAERVRRIKTIVRLPREITCSGGNRALRHDPELVSVEMEGVWAIVQILDEEIDDLAFRNGDDELVV